MTLMLQSDIHYQSLHNMIKIIIRVSHFSILVYFFQDVQDVQDSRRLLVIMFWILCDFRSILFCNTPYQLYIYIS